MDYQERVLALLTSIDASLRTLVKQQKAGAVADDRDLDSQYGNPKVTFNPRDWPGVSCKGRQMSDCPAEFLDLLASALEYFADQAEEKNEKTNTGNPVAPYKRKDAARARGWAKRIREGRVPAAASTARPNGWAETADEDWP